MEAKYCELKGPRDPSKRLRQVQTLQDIRPCLMPKYLIRLTVYRPPPHTYKTLLSSADHPFTLGMSIPQVAVSAETFASSVQFDTCITLAAFTLLYYDYALTVTSEINWYWNPPSPSVPFVLFTVSRYFGLLGPIPVFLEYFGHIPEHRCREIQQYHQVFAVASQAVVAVLLILRTYALYNRSKRVLILLVGMFVGGGAQSLAAVLTSVSPLSTSTLLNFGITGCNLSLNTEQGIHLALAWSAMLWFDTAIFALTFYKAMQVRHYMPGMLLVTMFRDGTIYYGILIVVNTLNITTFLIVPSGNPLKGTATTLTNVLSVVLTSRLMLNLRDPSIQTCVPLGGPRRHQGSFTGQFSSKMMSFRPPTVILDTFMTDDLQEGADILESAFT
ncbi:hypothetical protein BD310DRAFT_836735, partial [Dichomitus squalens]